MYVLCLARARHIYDPRDGVQGYRACHAEEAKTHSSGTDGASDGARSVRCEIYFGFDDTASESGDGGEESDDR